MTAPISTKRTPAKVTNVWREEPTWRDEFNGQQSWENPSCYSMPPVCQKAYNGGGSCPFGVSDKVRDLNKCNWSILNFPSNSNIDKHNMTFASAKNVEVKNGYLHLLVSTSGNPDVSNCGLEIVPGDPYAQGYTDQCPFFASGLWSRPMPGIGVVGNETRYGRFEVRARLSQEKALWPALWLMTPNAWPDTGEIDLMEWWGDKPDRIGGSLHSGKEVNGRHPFRTTKIKASEMNLPDDTFTSDFHTYAVEWEPRAIRFYLDGRNFSTIVPNNQEGMPIPGANGLYWILNNAVYEPKKEKDRADVNNFHPTPMQVDWVRTYAACETNDDFCPKGGQYINTPGDEHCLYLKTVDKKVISERKDPLCADYKNLYAEYLKSLEGAAGENKITKIYPNPFMMNMGTLKIQFSLTEPHLVEFNIVSMLGQIVRTLKPVDVLEAGNHELSWQGLSEGGAEFAAAAYIIQMIIKDPNNENAKQAGWGAKLIYLK